MPPTPRNVTLTIEPDERHVIRRYYVERVIAAMDDGAAETSSDPGGYDGLLARLDDLVVLRSRLYDLEPAPAEAITLRLRADDVVGALRESIDTTVYALAANAAEPTDAAELDAALRLRARFVEHVGVNLPGGAS